MSVIGETIKVLSANCQGLQNKNKMADVLKYMKEKRPNILCLQDTHWTPGDEKFIKQHWDGEVIIHGVRKNARGVGILFDKNFQYEIMKVEKDPDGNLLVVDLKMSDITVSQ